MGWSGVLYAAIIVGWAAYLIPHALRRYDEASRSRSVDRFSSAMRVLGRRTAPETVANLEASGSGSGATAARRTHRAAARAAALRRRRVLLLLLMLTVATIAAATRAVLPWWALAIPSTLVVGFLIAVGWRARSERRAYAASVAGPPVVAPVAPPIAPAAPPAIDGDPDNEDTVVLETAGSAQVAVPLQTSDGDVLWDPVPVMLPTYVSKPRAARTIRTIDLAQPGTWTSGRTRHEAALVGAAEAGRETEPGAAAGAPRAVGS